MGKVKIKVFEPVLITDDHGKTVLDVSHSKFKKEAKGKKFITIVCEHSPHFAIREKSGEIAFVEKIEGSASTSEAVPKFKGPAPKPTAGPRTQKCGAGSKPEADKKSEVVEKE